MWTRMARVTGLLLENRIMAKRMESGLMIQTASRALVITNLAISREIGLGVMDKKDTIY
jgi:hypothetical protein